MKTHLKPHIRLTTDNRHHRVLVCGSPERAAFISEFLESPQKVAQNREYHSYLGSFLGRDILVTSHGVGSAGAAICFQELIDVGARFIIRVGTAGGLLDDARISDVVVPTAAVRKDGVSSLMIPPEFPAIPDPDLAASLARKLADHFASSHLAQPPSFRRGVVLTSDLYYRGPLDDQLHLFKKAGAIAVEMECSTLFVIGHLRGIQTAAALVLDGNPLKWEQGEFDNDPRRLQASIEACAQAALKALAERD